MTAKKIPNPGVFVNEVGQLVLACKFDEARQLALDVSYSVRTALPRFEDEDRKEALRLYAMLASTQLTAIDQAQEILDTHTKANI
jgi:hypothetical protein